MQTPVPYGSKLHIPLTNYNLLAAQQELYKKGGAATCQLDINSNTCSSRHAWSWYAREMQTHNNGSRKESVAYLYHHLCPRYGVSGGFG